VIATSVVYDLVFVVHIMAAVGTIIVFIAMRVAALGVIRGVDAQTQALRFPQRRNWAARVIHLLPITGFIMTSSGGPSVTISHLWIIVGLICYLAAAGHLEAKTLPEERLVAATIGRDGIATKDQGRQLLRSIDILLAIVALALITMLVQY
jgi:hypothetical protein